MKSAGKARSNGLYRHIRTSKEIIRNLLNDWIELSGFLTYKMWVSLLRGILRKSAKSFLVFISLKFPMIFLLKKVSAWQLITLDKHE